MNWTDVVVISGDGIADAPRRCWSQGFDGSGWGVGPEQPVLARTSRNDREDDDDDEHAAGEIRRWDVLHLFRE